MLARDYSRIKPTNNGSFVQKHFPSSMEGFGASSRAPTPQNPSKIKTKRRGSVYAKTGEKISSSGGSPFGQISSLTCVMSKGGGQIIITDEIQHCVFLYNSDGTLKTKIGSKGINETQFMFPKCIALSGASEQQQQTAVADTNNHRILIFTPDLTRYIGKYQAHKHEIKKGSAPGEFTNPAGVCWTTIPTGAGLTKTVMIDGMPEDVTEPHQPSLIVADTGNNRIQVLRPEGEPPLTFGRGGGGMGTKKVGYFKEPTSVAFHDGWSERDKEYSLRCKEMRSSGENVPYYFVGDKISRVDCFERLKVAGPGNFLIRNGTVPDTWRILHVTAASFRRAEVEEQSIKLRDDKFYCPLDKREDGHPKVYKTMSDLVDDGGWMELEERGETRKWGRIAVCDSGNDRIQVVGYIPPTYYQCKEDGKSVCLFQHKFAVVQVLGTGSRGSKGPCHLTSPQSCAYNSAGDLICCDYGHWRVCIFAPDGEMVHEIGNRLELTDNGFMKPLACNFGRDYVGNDSVLIGYHKGGILNYSVPPQAIRGELAHLPREFVLGAFSFLDYHAAGRAAIACSMFNKVFTELRDRWDLYPLRPKVFERIKQLFVDWARTKDGKRIEGHLSSRDAYAVEGERGTDINWWMENYYQKGKVMKQQSDLTRQIEAERRRKEAKRIEKERLKAGGSKYAREELTVELVRNSSRIKDLLEMIKTLELTLTMESDWRWQLLCEDEEKGEDELLRRKEKFLKKLIISYLKPPVDEQKIKSSGAFVDFDVSIRCAVCDLCGLPFWWENERALEILFNSKGVDKEMVDYSDRLSRACEIHREQEEKSVKVMYYEDYLDFMTTVTEKRMGLRDWGASEALAKAPEHLKAPRSSTMKSPLVKNSTFDYQVGRAIHFVDKMFKPFEEKKESSDSESDSTSDDCKDDEEDLTLRVGWNPTAKVKPRKGSVYSSYNKDISAMRKF